MGHAQAPATKCVGAESETVRTGRTQAACLMGMVVLARCAAGVGVSPAAAAVIAVVCCCDE
jgi:hypothetical protein